MGGDKVYFDCTEGGDLDLGQVYEFDPGTQTIKLIYESTNGAMLENPDNIVIVPKTGDIFLQEESEDEQFVRGLTPEGKIYDFAKTITNIMEFCGGSSRRTARSSFSTSRAPAIACRRDLQTGAR